MPQQTTNAVAVLQASIALVSTVFPEAQAVFVGLKAIWLAKNPGKTDADWIADLAAASSQLTSDADAQLLKDGWTQNPITKEWTPPAQG